jgi:MerR family transcriptional regulator, light-induced transcriptional regulator
MTDSTDRATRDGSGAVGGIDGRDARLAGARRARVQRVSAASLLSERFLDELSAAVRGQDPLRRHGVVREMLAARIRPEDITDFYIPEVARRLGAAWCDDGMSFADVTIGSARLQGLLKESGQGGATAHRTTPMRRGFWSWCMADEFHTLGAMVLCGQLARLGVSVKLSMGQSESDVLRMVAAGQFDAIFISVAQGEHVAQLKKLVEKIRAASVRPVPVVIGGSVVTRVDGHKDKTGADHATTDPREALRACGLKSSVPGARQRATSE